MNIFDKLMLAKQLNFTDGKVELLGQEILFCPSDFIARYTLQINNSSDRVKELYEVAKITVREGFGIKVGKSYGFSSRDYTSWFADILKMAGWGKVTWWENDLQNHKGVIDIQGSPIAIYLKGKVNMVCDHVVRGFMAGGGCSTYNADIDVIETECEAIGAQKCRFIVDSKENLTAKFPELSQQQL